MGPGDHHRQREVQVPRGPLPAQLPGNGVLWHPRDHLQLHHEVRRRYQEGPVCQHCPLWWHHHVPWNCRQNAEGDHCPGSLNHEDQDHRSQRGGTPSGSEAPSWLPSPPSSRCGSPSRITMSPAPPSCTGSVSKKPEGDLATLPPCDLRRQSDTSCHVLAVFCLV